MYELAFAISVAQSESSIFIDDKQANLEQVKLGFRTHHLQSVAERLSFFRDYGLNVLKVESHPRN